MQVKEKIAERVKLSEQARAIYTAAEKDGNRALTSEERDQVRKLDAAIRGLRDELEKAAAEAEEDRQLRASLEAEERALSQSRGRQTATSVVDLSQGSVDDADLAFRGWCLGRRATEAQRAAARRLGFDVTAPDINMAVRTRMVDGKEVRSYVPVLVNGVGDILGEETRSVEGRALSVGTTTAGGNSIGNEAIRRYYEVQKWYAQVENQALVVNTETGATLPWPTVSDTANSGRILAEATTATTTTDPTFGVVNLGAFKFSSDAVLVSWELLQDSFIDIAGYLGTALGRRIGRIKNNKFTAGAGTTEPKGIITAATTGVTAGASTAFLADDIVSLVHTLDKAYRGLPGTGFMLHDTIAAYVRKFKDGTGRYLWETSMQLGQPDRLLGYPVTINNDMDSALTTGKKLVAFGNIGLAYVVRNAGAVRFVRAEERYVLEHQVVFEASQRSDGNLVDATAFQLLVLA